MAEYKVGNIVKGTVSGIETYGAFINFDEYYSRLIHISEISDNFVKNIKNVNFLWTQTKSIDSS